ncbi:RHS repeat domain-containing protein, partial [Chengkuizengella marina]
YYVITAVNQIGESEVSSEVMATPNESIGTYTYHYDENGRLTSIVLLSGETLVYEYDINGNLIRSYIQP